MTRSLAALLVLVLVSGLPGAAPPRTTRNLTPSEQTELDALTASLRAAETASELEQAVRVAERIAAFRSERQGARHWQAIDARFAVEEARRLARVPVKHHPTVVRIKRLAAEGVALWDKGHFRDSERPLREALALSIEALGEQHPVTADRYSGVARSQVYQSKHAEALPLFRRALTIRLKSLGQQHPATADAYARLAWSLTCLGKDGEAEALNQRALTIRLAALGERHPDTAQSCSGLAFAQYQLGKPGEALVLYRRALAIRLETLGERHPETIADYDNVASCLNAQGKFAEALLLARRVLDIRLETLGELHTDTARSYNTVASFLSRQGKQAEALPMHRRALSLARRALGEQHPDTATYYSNLAFCLGYQGKHDEALPLHRRALEIRLKVFGEQHPSTAASYGAVAVYLDLKGKHAEALPLHRRAIKVRLEILGELHPETAVGYTEMGRCLASQGRAGDALPLFRRAMDIYLKTYGEQHHRTAAASGMLAACLDMQGEHVEALTLHRRALALHRKMHGDRNHWTAVSSSNLALCLLQQGKLAEGLTHFRQALDVSRDVDGEHHQSTATGYSNVAFVLAQQGKHGEALPMLRRALDIRRQIDGEHSPNTADCSNRLAVTLIALGRRAEALQLLLDSLPGQEVARFHTAPTGLERALASTAKASPHAMLAAGLAVSGQPHDAFRHAEFALARGLLDDLAGPECAERSASTTAELRDLEKRLVPLFARATLSAEEKNLRDQLAKRRGQLQGDLAKRAAAVSARQVLPTERIRKQLPADTALVLWVDDLGEHLGCVLRREGPPAWVSLPGSGKDGAWTAADSSLPERTYAALTDPSAGPATRQALYRQRLAPLEGHLKGVRRLLVVPTGALVKVPVEALTDRWLVGYVPSGSAFARAAELPRRTRPTSALVLADPVFTRTRPKYPPAPPHGLLVKAIVPGSLAARIGLRPGDVLLEYRDKALVSPADLSSSAGEEHVPVKLWRAGKALAGRIPAGKLGVVLDTRPVAEALAAWRAEESKLLAADRSEDWAALPGARLEARSLVALLPSATLLLGSTASEQALEELAASDRLRRVSLIHLATHGQVDRGRPLETALVLAQDKLPSPEAQATRVLAGKRPLEGRLTVDAVRQTWRLDADLVTLSACRSGLGVDAQGEGMLGFAQVLLQKGARSVLLSRWQVDDAATALLMVRFYENLLGKRPGLTAPLPKAEALSEAKAWLRGLTRAEAEQRLTLLVDGVPRGERGPVRPALPARRHSPGAVGDRPFAHPYYWAAFVLIGDPG